MKNYVILILLAVFMAFATGQSFYLLFREHSASSKDLIAISRLKIKFQKEIAPITVIDFFSIYANSFQKKLIDPDEIIQGSFKSKSNFYSSKKACGKEIKFGINSHAGEKAWIWEQFRCGRLGQLPQSFFSSVPYLHPSGHSYAWLALNLGTNKFTSVKWGRKYVNTFHILELSHLKSIIGKLPGVFSILEKLTKEDLYGIKMGYGTVLTQDYLIARLNYPDIFSILEYRIYLRTDLDKFLKNTAYRISLVEDGSRCFYKDGQICWNYSVGHILKEANKHNWVIFIGLIAIIIVVVRILILKIKNQRIDEKRKRMALQVLTHEFRTPVASLMLNIESLSQNMCHLDEDMQEVILRISAEIYRLRRLTEKSKNYLQLNQGKKIIATNIEKIMSVNDFMDDFLATYFDQYGDDLVYHQLSSDMELSTDPFWFRICLKNIIENAFFHGDPPVKISLKKMPKNILEINISDQGHCQFDDLDKMASEFVKGGSSSGTGLGLNIVVTVFKELGGQVEFSTGPTQFKLLL